jgi:hypothetical protein
MEATGEARSNTWWDSEIVFKRKLCMGGDRVIVWHQTIVNTARRAAFKTRPTHEPEESADASPHLITVKSTDELVEAALE